VICPQRKRLLFFYPRAILGRYKAAMFLNLFRNLFGRKKADDQGQVVTVYTTYYLQTQRQPLSPEKLIEKYQEQFRSNLIGTWYAANGTFNGMMNERIIFYPDHTGRHDNFGPFGGLRDSSFFEWQEVSDYVLRLRVTGWTDNEGDPSDEEEEEEEDEPEEWAEVQYGFGTKMTDFGEEVILQQILADGSIRKEGIWNSFFDMGYSGPPETVEES